jgi:hypothetical protein
VETAEQVSTVYSRFDGQEYRVSETGNTVNYSGPDFDIQFSKNDPANTISGEAKSRVSFLNYEIMQMMRTSYESSSRHTSG